MPKKSSKYRNVSIPRGLTEEAEDLLGTSALYTGVPDLVRDLIRDWIRREQERQAGLQLQAQGYSFLEELITLAEEGRKDEIVERLLKITVSE